MKKNNLKIDIITSSFEWSMAFKTKLGCPSVNNTQLWWIPFDEGEQDLQPNFNSYKQIGGWKAPTRKMYENKIVCNISTYVNYYK